MKKFRYPRKINIDKLKRKPVAYEWALEMGLHKTERAVYDWIKDTADKRSYSDIAKEMGISRDAVRNNAIKLYNAGIVTDKELLSKGNTRKDLSTCMRGVNILLKRVYIEWYKYYHKEV